MIEVLNLSILSVLILEVICLVCYKQKESSGSLCLRLFDNRYCHKQFVLVMA